VANDPGDRGIIEGAEWRYLDEPSSQWRGSCVITLPRLQHEEPKETEEQTDAQPNDYRGRLEYVDVNDCVNVGVWLANIALRELTVDRSLGKSDYRQVVRLEEVKIGDMALHLDGGTLNTDRLEVTENGLVIGHGLVSHMTRTKGLVLDIEEERCPDEGSFKGGECYKRLFVDYK
jgi:hypothetical protein